MKSTTCRSIVGLYTLGPIVTGDMNLEKTLLIANVLPNVTCMVWSTWGLNMSSVGKMVAMLMRRFGGGSGSVVNGWVLMMMMMMMMMMMIDITILIVLMIIIGFIIISSVFWCLDVDLSDVIAPPKLIWDGWIEAICAGVNIPPPET